MHLWHQNTIQFITHPYLFFEKAIAKNNPILATIVFLISWLINYLGWGLVNTGILRSPSFIPSIFLTLITYPIAVIVIYLVCRLLVRETRLNSFFCVWGFSYLPTLLFSMGNILFHLFQKFSWFSTTITNPLFQMSLWAFFFLMLLWKILLLAITLRLAGNLNLKQIVQAIAILALAVGFYWWGGLVLGWLKIPFI